MTQQSDAIEPQRSKAGSKIINGTSVLPKTDGRSSWARMFRAEVQALTAHLGGEDRVSEPHRVLIRRAATFESELVELEITLANARAAGEPVEDKTLDLYQRLTNSQRRVLEAIGLTRQAFDAVPTLDSYVSGKAKPTK